MNGKPLVTLALVPLAALAALVAPALRPAAPPPVPAPAVGGVHATLTPDRDLVYADGDRTLRLRLDLWSDDPSTPSTRPTDLVVVLDRSGSMAGDKLLDARAAAHQLVSELGRDDRFALVSFASDATVDVPLQALDPARRGAWDVAIDGVQAGGSTELAAGLALGLGQAPPAAGRVRRVVLVSDGLPDDRAGLDDLARRAASAESPLTTVGIGDDYDEGLMRELADEGTGNFHWVRRGPDLARVLADELSTAHDTVASGLELRLDGVSLVDAAGLPLDDTGRVALGGLFAGQHRSLWLTVRVPDGVDGEAALGAADLSFTTPAGQPGAVVATAPAVRLTHDAPTAYRALGDAWADGVVQQEWNALEVRVAAEVQRGDRDAALAAITEYRERNEVANAWAGNRAVADNLADADDLARQVNDNFEGEDQRARQNVWAKTHCEQGYLGTRAGQMK